MKNAWDGNIPLTQHTTNEAMDGANGLTSVNRAMREEILHRARSIWEERGRPVGEDLSIWLEAEGQILSGKPSASQRS